MLKPYKGILPTVDPTAFIEESAQIVGEVTIGAESSVWHGAVVRGDVAPISIGARTNIQDNSVVHVTKTPRTPTVLGDDITVGHSVTLHGCVIEGPALIGMGAIVMDRAHLAPNVIVAAGALVPEGMQVPPGSLVMGMPAKVKRPLTEEETAFLTRSAKNYVGYRLDYMGE
ncbi:MAG: gamma carbonic anhydrase family protein [Nitrospinae bacterium]|nr:gamma carbonic anhydrase family protein [Nitrospinota bacterium]